MIEFKRSIGGPTSSERPGLVRRVLVLVPVLVSAIAAAGAAHAMATGGGSQQGGGLAAFLPLILIVVIFYFLLIRPQTKRQKEHKMMLTTLRKGDKVVTNSGMFGTIVGMDDKENKVVLKVAEGVKIEFLKSSIAGRVGAQD
jgi:preprotein translocase subunit YajC